MAVRYHEFKTHSGQVQVVRTLRRVSAEAILERAQEILGSIVHPQVPRVSALQDLPPGVQQFELSVEDTLDENPGLRLPLPDLWVEFSERRSQPVVLAVDTSLSMTGEKLALTAVALAVVLLQFPDDPVGIVAFENEATVLKKPSERLTIGEFVERFLDVPAKGYTHLEAGLRGALRLQADPGIRRGAGRCSTLLLSDGKYTAGRDPTYLAPRFDQLHVLKMGRERSSRELCQDLARRGGGGVREVAQLEQLPEAMYAAVKDLLRGRRAG